MKALISKKLKDKLQSLRGEIAKAEIQVATRKSEVQAIEKRLPNLKGEEKEAELLLKNTQGKISLAKEALAKFSQDAKKKETEVLEHLRQVETAKSKIKSAREDLHDAIQKTRVDFKRRQAETILEIKDNTTHLQEAKETLDSLLSEADVKHGFFKPIVPSPTLIKSLDARELLDEWKSSVSIPLSHHVVKDSLSHRLSAKIYSELRQRCRDGKLDSAKIADATKKARKESLLLIMNLVQPADRKFLRRDAAAIPREKAESWTRKISPTPALPALFLTKPHPELMWKGDKKLIVKSKKFDMTDKDYYLVDNDKTYGIIRITEIKEIDDKEYKKLAPRHKISPEEKKRWAKTIPAWRKAPYWSYDFKWVEKFKAPRNSEVPHGTQVFVAPEKLMFLDSCRLPTVEEIPEFVWTPDFISLTGSAAYQRKEPRDIDLIVKAEKNDEGSFLITLDPAINIKIQRIFDKIYPDKVVQWIPSISGGDWDHYPLYDLVLRPKQKIVLREMYEPAFKEICYDAKKKVVPFTFVRPLKPMAGRYKQEEYSIDSIIKVVESRKDDWYKIGTYVEQKFDGFVVSVHKDKDKVVIFTSEGRDVAEQLPTLTESVKAIPGSFVIAGEIEHWSKGIHSPRQKTVSIIHTKKIEPEEKGVRLNVFDMLYWNGKDIHALPFSERIKYADKIPDGENIKKSKRRLVHSREDLKKAIEHFSKQPGAEGGYLKLANFPYELDGSTRNNIKFKNTHGIECEVLKVFEVES